MRSSPSSPPRAYFQPPSGAGFFKPFDKALYDQHDLLGKRRVAAWLSAYGFEVKPGGTYDIDLLVYRHGELVCEVEVEQRNFNGQCTYKTIHVAERKRKFFQGKISALFAVDMKGKWAYYTSGKNILNSPLIELPNKYQNGEYFYDVPIQAWREIRIDQHG